MQNFETCWDLAKLIFHTFSKQLSYTGQQGTGIARLSVIEIENNEYGTGTSNHVVQLNCKSNIQEILSGHSDCHVAIACGKMVPIYTIFIQVCAVT